jgi:hypothetical protein
MKQFNKFKVGPGKSKPIDFLQTDPLKIHGAVQGHIPGYIITVKHIHFNLKMGICMLDSASAQHITFKGQAVQAGDVGVQINAPSSMTAWLKPPGSVRSKSASATGLNLPWAEEWFTGTSRQNNRERTRLTLPSTTAWAFPKAMLNTADAI